MGAVLLWSVEDIFSLWCPSGPRQGLCPCLPCQMHCTPSDTSEQPHGKAERMSSPFQSTEKETWAAFDLLFILSVTLTRHRGKKNPTKQKQLEASGVYKKYSSVNCCHKRQLLMGLQMNENVKLRICLSCLASIPVVMLWKFDLFCHF